jgi:hypothetical protein
MSAWLEEIMKGLGSAVAWSFAGRAMWLAQEFRAGKRKIISWALLLWELPIADYMTWDDTKRDALVVVVAYLGPRIIEQTWEAVKGVLPGFFQKKD